VVGRQAELPWAEVTTTRQSPPPGCQYFADFLSDEEAGQLLGTLWRDLPWQQKPIRLFGREVMQPRLICWQSDPEVFYTYSGLTLYPEAWLPELDRLRSRLCTKVSWQFNSVLANAYRDGQDSMGWHSDDEPELGPEPVIAAISLGATRTFRWREKRGHGSGGIVLESGSLLLMSGHFQRFFQHSVPKTLRETGLRINLTFRKILPR